MRCKCVVRRLPPNLPHEAAEGVFKQWMSSAVMYSYHPYAIEYVVEPREGAQGGWRGT